MKIINLLIIPALFSIIYGCNSDRVFVGKHKYGLEFEKECIKPQTEPILELPAGSSIQIIDTLLLVQHQDENSSYYWDVYSLNNMMYLKSILRKGRGPNEVLFAHYAGQYEKTEDAVWMYFLDVNSGRFLKINLTESVRPGNDVIELVTAIESDKFPYFAVNNDTFIYCNKNRDEGYISLVKGDNSWKNPVMEKRYIRHITSGDFNKLTHSLYYNKKNNKVCAVPFYINHIQIIDLEGKDDIISSAAGNNNWETVNRNDISGLTTIFYTTTRTTDDLIFALYNNRQIAEMGNTPGQTVIHVFDWNGKALTRILLEDSIISFAVDIKSKMLYGLDNGSYIHRYDISSCL